MFNIDPLYTAQNARGYETNQGDIRYEWIITSATVMNCLGDRYPDAHSRCTIKGASACTIIV